jgi:hypothetical protein
MVMCASSAAFIGIALASIVQGASWSAGSRSTATGRLRRTGQTRCSNCL